MESYKTWVRRNREFVHSLESLANGITWLLPERFSNSEIGPEAVYAFIGILGAVNQHIIDTTPSIVSPSKAKDSSFPWSLCVSTLKDLETLVEVSSQYLFGDHGKWNFLAGTEAVKAIVRLALFRDSGYKMLLQGGELANLDKDRHHAETRNFEMENSGLSHKNSGHGYSRQYDDHIPADLEKRALSALSKFGEKAKMSSDPDWVNKHMPMRETSGALVTKRPSLSTIWYESGLYGQLFVTGEVFYILRPLIYVLLIRKFGVRSWIPWFISLGVDFTGIGLLSIVRNPKHEGKIPLCKFSTSEKDELKRRKMILALYIMRDPFFTRHTKNYLEKTDNYLRLVPGIGFLIGKLVELIIGAQTRYTYTSGS